MKIVERKEDMSSTGRLRILQQPDGDIIVAVIPAIGDWMRQNSVEFCAICSGGGRSPKTLAALRNLMDAIDQDNAERPLGD